MVPCQIVFPTLLQLASRLLSSKVARLTNNLLWFWVWLISEPFCFGPIWFFLSNQKFWFIRMYSQVLQKWPTPAKIEYHLGKVCRKNYLDDEQLLNENMGWKIIRPTFVFFFLSNQKFWFFRMYSQELQKWPTPAKVEYYLDDE